MTIKVLHITPHLGGGVGRVLTKIVKYNLEHESNIEHTVVCLENPIKRQPEVINNRVNFIIRPLTTYLKELIEDSDIIQLEWWNHPSTVKYLSNLPPLPIRLLTWYHNSGTNWEYTPNEIEKQLILNSHIFLFTTEASLKNEDVKYLIPTYEDNLGVVYASGGFDDFPLPRNRTMEPISIGYFGTLKFSKINPSYMHWIKAIPEYLPDISIKSIKIIGDISSIESKNIVNSFQNQCIDIKKSDLIKFTGYLENPIPELDKLNVLAYILNPNHYGTTENSLLQCMSMGIVPIVLNNPAERQLITDKKTGFILPYTTTQQENFAKVIKFLHENPEERQRIGENASKYVREKFSIENTYNQLTNYYNKILNQKKRKINFKEILNSCQKH